MTKSNYTNMEQMHKALKSVVTLVKMHHFIETLPAASNKLIATKVLFRAMSADACVWVSQLQWKLLECIESHSLILQLQQILKADFFECTESGVERFLSLLEVYATMTDTAEASHEICNPNVNALDVNCLTS